MTPRWRGPPSQGCASVRPRTALQGTVLQSPESSRPPAGAAASFLSVSAPSPRRCHSAEQALLPQGPVPVPERPACPRPTTFVRSSEQPSLSPRGSACAAPADRGGPLRPAATGGPDRTPRAGSSGEAVARQTLSFRNSVSVEVPA